MASLYILVALSWILSASAIPVADAAVAASAGPSPVALVVGLCTPFIILATIKYTYLKYRRAECIHSESVELHVEAKAPRRLIGLGFDSQILQKPSQKLRIRCLSGYLVGFLGSPDWETRMKIRVDRVIRKTRPPFAEGTSGSASSSLVSCPNFGDPHQSRATSLGERRSSRPASSRYSSSRSRTMSLSFLELYSPDPTSIHASSPGCPDTHLMPPLPSETLRYIPNTSKSRSQSSLPKTYLQVTDPALLSANKDREKSPGTSRRGTTQSPTPPYETPPTSPPETSQDKSVRTTYLSVAPTSRPVSTASSFGLTNSIYSTPSVAFPISFSVLPPPSADRLQPASPQPQNSPLSPTTRPLNISKSLSPLLSFKSNFLAPGDRSADRSNGSKSSQRRKSGSPAPGVGPSPLRNPVEPSQSASLSAERLISEDSHEGSAGSGGSVTAASWELSDLMKNGRLDVDAVSEALGLGFSLDDAPSPRVDSVPSDLHLDNLDNLDSLVRRPGGPLYAIPEESDAEESIADRDARPLSSVIERWGRVQRTQQAKRDANGNEIRESASSSILEVDLSLLGIDVSAISGIEVPVPLSSRRRDSAAALSDAWEEEASTGWRDDSNASGTIGLAC